VTRILVVMDALERIQAYKDTTVGMLLEARRRGYATEVAGIGDLWAADGRLHVSALPLEVRDDPDDWYSAGEPRVRAAGAFDVILMRKDPPVDMRYFYATQLLDLAQRDGVAVVNSPQSLRDGNEKLAALWFREWTPPTLVSGHAGRLREFVIGQGRAVLKPLAGMGGQGVFLTAGDDPNLNVIIETLTRDGAEPIMAQAYLDAISDGDKRVLLVNGNPVPCMLARIPGACDFRGNLARGGRGEPRELGAAEERMARAIGPKLRARGVLFAGLDVIGDRLTEVNVTSPTCLRELDAAFGINIAGDFFDAVETLDG